MAFDGFLWLLVASDGPLSAAVGSLSSDTCRAACCSKVVARDLVRLPSWLAVLVTRCSAPPDVLIPHGHTSRSRVLTSHLLAVRVTAVRRCASPEHSRRSARRHSMCVPLAASISRRTPTASLSPSLWPLSPLSVACALRLHLASCAGSRGLAHSSRTGSGTAGAHTALADSRCSTAPQLHSSTAL